MIPIRIGLAPVDTMRGVTPTVAIMSQVLAVKSVVCRLATQRTAVTILLLSCFVAPTGAEEGTALSLYTNALARERELRAPAETPTSNDLRIAIATYEDIVRRFPTSEYADHALWQASGLAIEAFDRFRQPQDFDNGIRLLDTLVREYTISSLASRVGERRQQLETLQQLAWLYSIEREVLDTTVRVTVHLDDEVQFHSDHIQDPSRLFFDLPGTETTESLRNTTLTFDDDSEVVRAIWLGRHPNHTTRLVLDMENVSDYHVSILYNPFRLIVDCRRTDTKTEETTPPLTAATSYPIPAAPAPRPAPKLEMQHKRSRKAATRGELESEPTRISTPDRGFKTVDTTPPVHPSATIKKTTSAPVPSNDLSILLPATNSTGTYSLARQLGLGVSRIVIDPGHGGLDSGARAHGLVEADLVLDIAHRLEQRLSFYPHLEVVLTRRTDDYVPLEARTALARRVGADLFLSIHANASHRSWTRGVETYFLNFATDPEVEVLAARENGAGIGSMANLQQLVQAITTNNKLEESRDFAEIVHSSMLTKLRGVDPSVPDLGVKQAPFVVLIGADIPSVLTEISFVTNNHDATMLQTETYRDLIADALFDGVLRYQLSLETASRVVWQVDNNEGS